jgi:hypothetical protein
MAAGISADQILRKYSSFQDILLDKDLAKLGDAYINFVYSLALSQKLKKPTGAKVDNQTLAEAVKRAGLREKLPRRLDRHTRGNVAEALIAYAWLKQILGLEDCVRFLKEIENPLEAFTELLIEINKRLGVADV